MIVSDEALRTPRARWVSLSSARQRRPRRSGPSWSPTRRRRRAERRARRRRASKKTAAAEESRLLCGGERDGVIGEIPVARFFFLFASVAGVWAVKQWLSGQLIPAAIVGKYLSMVALAQRAARRAVRHLVPPKSDLFDRQPRAPSRRGSLTQDVWRGGLAAGAAVERALSGIANWSPRTRRALQRWRACRAGPVARGRKTNVVRAVGPRTDGASRRTACGVCRGRAPRSARSRDPAAPCRSPALSHLTNDKVYPDDDVMDLTNSCFLIAQDGSSRAAQLPTILAVAYVRARGHRTRRG